MKRRRLGQHYLVDPDVVRRIVSAAGIRHTERVLEIGTGRGALTKALANLGASYVGYEIDRQNFDETVRVVQGTTAQVLLADAFEQAPEFDVLVSSLPYSESSSFVRWLSMTKFDRAVVLLQDDFVKKLLASPGTRDYRAVSALSQLCFEVRVLERVKRDSFSPRPRVGSVMASFAPRLRVERTEVANIFRLFSLRRRLVDSALAELGMNRDESFGRRRVYSLLPDEVHLLCSPKRQ